jgi:hypothetical protein
VSVPGWFCGGGAYRSLGLIDGGTIVPLYHVSLYLLGDPSVPVSLCDSLAVVSWLVVMDIGHWWEREARGRLDIQLLCFLSRHPAKPPAYKHQPPLISTNTSTSFQHRISRPSPPRHLAPLRVSKFQDDGLHDHAPRLASIPALLVPAAVPAHPAFRPRPGRPRPLAAKQRERKRDGTPARPRARPLLDERNAVPPGMAKGHLASSSL